jgi:hypothetical protein
MPATRSVLVTRLFVAHVGQYTLYLAFGGFCTKMFRGISQYNNCQNDHNSII